MSATPMPYSVRFTVLMVILSEHTILFMVPTFVSYMVAGFYPDELDQSLISSRSGYVEGVAGTMGFVGCLLWGSVSDKIGRKKALIIVLCGMIVASIGFGLAPYYEYCLFWRGVAGVMAGVVPISKALIQDISDETNVTILYSYLGMGYGFASIMGPFIGGLLAKPANNFAFLQGTVFETFPYLLPMICHSTIALTAIIMVLVFIKPKEKSKKEVKAEHGASDLLKNKNYLMGVLIFVLVGVIQFGYRIIMACWVKVKQDEGGLGFEKESMVGIMNSLSGIVVTLYHFYGVPTMSKNFGVIKSAIIINLQLIPIILIISFCNSMMGFDYLFWPMIIITNGLSIASTTAYISFISIAISNSVTPDILGLATGITQSIIACIRGVSIAGFGVIFAAFQRWKLPFPLDLHFPFFFLIVVLCLILILVKYCLSREVEKRKPVEPKAVPLLERNKEDA